MTLLETAQAGLFTEADLLGPEASPDDASSQTKTHDHAVVTAPILTGDALDVLDSATFPQRALYGRVISQHGNGVPLRPENSRLFINTNAPFSALVCGVQGSGKSHSTSVLLESVLIQDERLGQLPEPLSAIVFHLDSAAGGGMVQPCEAAYLASIDRVRGGDIQAPPVTVLVLPNNLRSMRMVYARLPGVCVEPLHFASRDISGERLLSMMKVDESTQMPLYMEAIMNILRKMNDSFDYAAFRQQLAAQKFNSGQKAMLNLRLSLLDSCLEGGTAENSINTHFRKGQLTIIDLSSPFMDGSSACGFFDIILGLFVEADIQGSGKIVVLDEAHKYLSDQGASSCLTNSLLTVIRQQRHLATRVVISTQEPTVVPEKFIDLCSFVIAHRFSSPTWLKHLLQHISALDGSSKELWDKILSLNTGHAILFSPNGLYVKSSDEKPEPQVSSLGQGYLTVRSRLRVTRDGGHSLLAVQDTQHSTQLGRMKATLLAPVDSPLPQAKSDTRSEAAAQTHKQMFGSCPTTTNAVPPPVTYSSTSALPMTVPRRWTCQEDMHAFLDIVTSRVPTRLADTEVPSGPVIQTTPPEVVKPAHTSVQVEPLPAKFESEDDIEVLPHSGDVQPPGPAAGPLLRLLAQTHSNGYPLVAFSYLCGQLLPAKKGRMIGSKAEMRAALALLLATRQVIAGPGVGGQVFRLPDDSPHRCPIRMQAQPIPSTNESEFAPLIQYLRSYSGTAVRQKLLRNHLKNNMPDAPLGQKMSKITDAIKRACQAGVVNFGGSGKQAWISSK